MRDIKFRAWIREGPWQEPDEMEQTHVMLYGDELAFEEYEPINDLLAGVENLMQYTGLKDKNGKEVYEGDICRIYEGKSWISEVAFVGAGFCFVNRNCCSVCASGRGCIGSIDEFGDPIEVIGNIYESPGLLGGTPENPELLK